MKIDASYNDSNGTNSGDAFSVSSICTSCIFLAEQSTETQPKSAVAAAAIIS